MRIPITNIPSPHWLIMKRTWTLTVGHHPDSSQVQGSRLSMRSGEGDRPFFFFFLFFSFSTSKHSTMAHLFVGFSCFLFQAVFVFAFPIFFSGGEWAEFKPVSLESGHYSK
ncbi:hypothetical protein BDV12DRAFT_47807 [Aspergillus spectabilis]